MKIKPIMTFPVRPIENGFILNASVGLPYSSTRSYGETFYPDLAQVGAAIVEIIAKADATIEELIRERDAKKPSVSK